MRFRYRLARRALAVVLLATAVPTQAAGRSPTLAHSASASILSIRTFSAPGPVTHLAVHWRGARGARVRVALSHDGRHFARSVPVELDDVFEAHPGSETYGSVFVARGVRAVRVLTDRPVRRLTVLWLDDRGRRARPVARSASIGFAQPKVIPRIDWGANEAYRFNSSGQESWPSAFFPVQKLIVHHTATQNNDPDPAATVRSIYYYHAVTQGWGDIGYNFLIDEAGNVYEGRHTLNYPSGSSPTEENSLGYGVTAAHAQGYNSGTVGIALLGTLTSQDATPSARSALKRLLAWESDHHGIDPQGASLYTNPVSGTQATFPNIAGHRDVTATKCPGGTFYATLPIIRSNVATMLGATAPAAPTGLSATAGDTQVSLAWNASAGATSYTVKRSTVTGGPYTALATGVTTTSYTDTGLTNGTTYYYVVSATNTGGESPTDSNQATATPTAPTAPPPSRCFSGDGDC